jgi:enterochelin esterase-like enzyme
MALALVSAAHSATGAPAAPAAPAHHADLGPKVVHTGAGPTGYTVTFRYYDPKATKVQITGEWYFANLGDISAPASTTTIVITPGLLPAQWQPGDFPIAYPNSLGPGWPVTNMTRHGNGVWTYTIPLPSGVFTYGFFVNCATKNQSGCTEVPDPGNPSWNGRAGSVAQDSEVYVPADARFGTVDYSWQGPSLGEHGHLIDVTYPSPTHKIPVGKNYLAIYTPPDYNPHRSKPYPTLYLTPGGSGTETDWAAHGDLANIMDNLIGTGEIQPMVVVLPNNNGFVDSATYSAFDADLISSVIPYVEKHYNVSTSAAQRAFSGLSGGGQVTNSLMLYHASAFRYYGVMSAGLPCPVRGAGCTTVTLKPAQAAALRQAAVYVGGGWQDPVHGAGFMGFDTGTLQEVSGLINAGVPITPDFVNGGHEWYAWRILLKDFLTRVAFFPPVSG